MRGVVMSSYPRLAACGSAGMLWSGRGGLIQPFPSSWSGNASLPLISVPGCPSSPCKQAQSVPELYN